MKKINVIWTIPISYFTRIASDIKLVTYSCTYTWLTISEIVALHGCSKGKASVYNWIHQTRSYRLLKTIGFPLALCLATRKDNLKLSEACLAIKQHFILFELSWEIRWTSCLSVYRTWTFFYHFHFARCGVRSLSSPGGGEKFAKWEDTGHVC